MTAAGNAMIQKNEGVYQEMEITKQTTMGQMLEYDMGIAYILMQSGMHCVGCPSSIGESLEEACQVHGLDADKVMETIQEYLNTRKEAEGYMCRASGRPVIAGPGKGRVV